MSVSQLVELHYGDIVEISAGLAKVSGYFIRKDDQMIYLGSAIPAFTNHASGPVVVPEPIGYYHANLEIEVLKKSDRR